jgi:hypothetical protein
MPPKANAPKRKADAPPGGENKSARTGDFRDAPTSKRQGLPRYPQLFLNFMFYLFIAPTNERTTGKGTEKGKYYPPLLQEWNKLNKLLQRTKKNQLDEQFGPIVVEVAMHINWRTP